MKRFGDGSVHGRRSRGQTRGQSVGKLVAATPVEILEGRTLLTVIIELPHHFEQLRLEMGDESFAALLQDNENQYGNLQGIGESVINEFGEQAYSEFEQIESTLNQWLDQFNNPCPDNNQPTAAPQTLTAFEDVLQEIILTGDDGDPEVIQPLTFVIETLPTTGTLILPRGGVISSGDLPVVLDDPGLFFLTAPNDVTQQVFDFKVVDSGSLESPTATVTIDVTSVNDKPTADSQTVTTFKDLKLPINLTGDDGDPEETQSLTFIIETLPAAGALIDSGGAPIVAGDLPLTLDDPVVFFINEENDVTPQSFDFKVIDDEPLESLIGTVDIEVAELPNQLEQLRLQLGDESFAAWLQNNQDQFETLQGVDESVVAGFDDETRQQFYEVESILEQWLDQFNNPCPDAPEPTSAIAGRVWNDLNANGVQDDGEPGLIDARVNLIDPRGGLVAFTNTTGPNGDYLFGLPVPGDYFIEFLPLPDQAVTFPGVGLDSTIDSDADLFGQTGLINVGPGLVIGDIDAGFIVPPTLSFPPLRIPENIGEAMIEVTVNHPTGALPFDVTLELLTPAVPIPPLPQLGVALPGADFGIVDVPHLVPAGTPNGTVIPILIPIIDDPLVEQQEFVPIEIVALSLRSVDPIMVVYEGTRTPVDIVITDDDSADVTFSGEAKAEGDSGNTPLNFEAVISNPSDIPVVIDFMTVDGTATTGDNDYVSNNGQLAFNGSGSQSHDILAYDPGFSGGVRVATGDINGDGTPDIITGAGPGGGPHVRVLDGANSTGPAVVDFFAYDQSFQGGVFVATGDINNDGTPDIITGAGAGGGPHVKVFDGSNPLKPLLANFFAFDAGFTGGVRVASGDVNNDGHDDIIVGSGPGAEPQVRVFDGQDTDAPPLKSFFAFDLGFTGGVFVAAGDVNNDGSDDVIVGAGHGSGPKVRVFDGNSGDPVRNFFAYDPGFTGGVRVGSADVNDDGFDDIIIGAGPGGPPQVRIFDGNSGGSSAAQVDSFIPYEPTFTGGIFVAGGSIVVGADAGGGPQVRVFDRTSPEKQTITVDIVGDTVSELNETFSVDFTLHASLQNVNTPETSATGTIVNDDSVVPGVRIEDGVLTIVGTSSADNVILHRRNTSKYRVRTTFAGTQNFDAGEITSIHVQLGDGNDRFNALGTFAVPLIVDAGDGHDRLVGSRGGDLLLGGPGNDFIWAGSGNNIVIGGTGRDFLFGGSGQDILIGGNTLFDVNPTVLGGLLAEWNSDADLDVRVRNLSNFNASGSGINGTNYLKATGSGQSVFDDDDRDLLFGGRSMDWLFFATGQDIGFGTIGDLLADDLDDFFRT